MASEAASHRSYLVTGLRLETPVVLLPRVTARCLFTEPDRGRSEGLKGPIADFWKQALCLLAKDWECLIRKALAFLRLASIRLILRKLCNPK
jgi:hypothetical protein